MDPSKNSSSDMMQQAEHIWKMLDELALSDPEGYKNFVKRSMNEQKQEVAIPEPFMCLKTDLLVDTSKKTVLFVNICSWTRVPAPKTSTDAVPVTGGPLEEIQSESGLCKVTRVAINPDVLKECSQRKEEMNLLIKLVFQFLENQHKIHISGKFAVLQETYHGDRMALVNFFGGKEKQRIDPVKESVELLQNMSPEALLARMNKLAKDEEDNLSGVMLDTEPVNDKIKGKVLIEEISSQEVSLPTPEYELTIKERDDRKMRRCLLRVALPGVSSVTECDLQLDSEKVSLHVADKYSLEVKIPEPFHEESVSAKFIRKSSTLSVTIPLKNDSC